VNTVPDVPHAKTETRAAPDDAPAEADRPEPIPGDANEAVGAGLPAPRALPKRSRRRIGPDRAAALRSAPGWRKVRLGLILIALAMALQYLSVILLCFIPLGVAWLGYLL
jgi:hypothetical protein